MNLGVDFGSTYSVISTYRKEYDRVEALELQQSSPYLPTEVCLKKGQYTFGRAAKSMAGQKGLRSFRGFKMLLSEENADIRESRGFDADPEAENSPEAITEKYLSNMLREAMAFYKAEKIDELVICAPEIWSQGIRTIDARTKLSEICRQMPFVENENVRVVSEPAAASAYFAFNFWKSTGKCYEGTILLIDYGGGTLDITLTRVETRDRVDGGVGMEIKVLERTGAGENEEGRIGKAGIVFMETLAEEAILAAGIGGSPEELRKEPAFYKFVNEVEDQLQSQTEAIGDVFNQYDVYDADEFREVVDEEDDEFATLYFKGGEVVIRFSLMLDVYNRVIRPVLAESLGKMVAYMDRGQIPYMDKDQDNFKIALVGGFGNFFLVKRQVEEAFRWSASLDRRSEGIILVKGDREKAVSMGAALLADHIVDIQNTAPYSIGIFALSGGEPVYIYAFTRRQNIELDVPYYPKKEDGSDCLYLVGGIDKLILESEEYPAGQVVRIREELRERMRQINKNNMPTFGIVGFSLDSAEVLHLHMRRYDVVRRTFRDEDEELDIPLTRLSDLFDPILF